MATWSKDDRPDVTTDEMYAIAEMVADKTLSDPELARKLQSSKLVLQFRYTDVERWGSEIVPTLTIDTTTDPIGVVTRDTELKPTITMTMEAFTAHLFWMEKLNILAAITRGHIKAKGPIPKAMRLLPMLKPLHTNYKLTLAELGREDLLAFPPD